MALAPALCWLQAFATPAILRTLIEAWESLEKEHPGEVLNTGGWLFAGRTKPETAQFPMAGELLAVARRPVLIAVSRDGVDINPMAVEMSKLSSVDHVDKSSTVHLSCTMHSVR